METAIRTQATQTVSLVPQESSFIDEATSFERTANELVVNCQSSYDYAAAFGKDIKQTSANIVAYFETMKKNAHRAWKEICNRENELLEPLQNAERTLKQSMGAYIQKVEQERRQAEIEAQRIAKEEADRKLAEAVELEENGNSEEALSAFADAQMADTVSRNIHIPSQAPKADGVSTTKGWRIIRVTDEVPTTLNGMVLRPICERSIMQLIKASKGTIKITGVEYEEVTNIAIRSK